MINTLSRLRGAGLVLLAMTAVFGLSGCGNAPTKAQGLRALNAAYDEIRLRENTAVASVPIGAGANVAPGTRQQVQLALKSIEGPVLVAVVVDEDQTAVLGFAGQNGPYRTWITGSRQTLVTRNGVLTGTRGLGFDLMSSEATAAMNLVTARRSGSVERIYRHIDGENHEVPTRMTCSIGPDGAETVTLLSGARISTTRMRETCVAPDLSVSNTYWVSGSGQIPQSRQWVSEQIGPVVLQVLRH